MTFTTRPEIRGTFGVVASTHWLGSAVGFGILERGGNAFDAAVATGFTLQVVEPHLNGPGGEVPVIGLAAGADRPFVLCGQGVAPAAATPERFAAEGVDAIPGTGHLPCVVPGAFDAWMLLLRDHGTVRLREALEPAIAYAANGFPLVPRIAQSIHAIAGHFRAHWPASAEIWLRGGRTPPPGRLFATPRIAATYARILEEAEAASPAREGQIEAARRIWREGFVAEAIDAFLREPVMDGTGTPHAGLLTGEDMARWSARYEPAVSRGHRGLAVHKTAAWGQGPILLMMLKLAERCGVDGTDLRSAEAVHALVEIAKLALADRDAWFADPEAADVPLDALLSDAYADARRTLVSGTASADLRPGDPLACAPLLRGPRAEALAALSARDVPRSLGDGEPTFAPLPEPEGDTVHLDVIDRWGNAVSATPSGGWLQSSPAVPALGFCLSTRGQMFTLDPRLPSLMRPGVRPRITLSPTLVTRDGAPWLALGTPGGDQQDQWTLQVLLRAIAGHDTLQAAIDAPMFHTAHYIASFAPRRFSPRRVHIEGRFADAVRADLAARGHDVVVDGDWSIGRMAAVGMDADGLRGAASPRFMQAYAVGR